MPASALTARNASASSASISADSAFRVSGRLRVRTATAPDRSCSTIGSCAEQSGLLTVAEASALIAYLRTSTGHARNKDMAPAKLGRDDLHRLLAAEFPEMFGDGGLS